MVDLLEAVQGQRFARFGRGVGELLELGEHRLAEDRPADGVDLAIDQEGPLAGCRCVASRYWLSSCFVEGAGHFGDEERILVVRVRLIAPEK